MKIVDCFSFAKIEMLPAAGAGIHEPQIRRTRLIFDFRARNLIDPRFWFNPKLVLATINIEDETIECRGGFCTEEHLMMDYRAKEKHVLQFGSMLLKLDAAGTCLEGDVVGYYNESFTAKLVLRKDTR